MPKEARKAGNASAPNEHHVLETHKALNKKYFKKMIIPMQSELYGLELSTFSLRRATFTLR